MLDKHALIWTMKTDDGLGYNGKQNKFYIISSPTRDRGNGDVLSVSRMCA
jgi:hypothetical protein